MQLFWKKGYEGAHLQELVETTGLNRFSLYKEFDGKDGLFRACMESYLVGSYKYYEETLARTPYGLDNIRAYFQSIRFPDEYDGCFFVNSLSERHVLEPASYELVQNFADFVEELYFKNVKAAMKAGEIDAKRDARALARFFTVNDFGLAVFGIGGSGKNRGLKDVVAMILGAVGE